MEVFLSYVLKVSCILTIFSSVYLLFLKNETFFRFNRYFLISGILAAIALPFIEVKRYVEIESLGGNTLLMNYAPNRLVASVSPEPIYWSLVFFMIYGIGFMVLTVRFIIQLWSLYRMFEGKVPRKFGDYYYVETSLDIAPFSFFHYIFYNPSLYTENELSAIIKHEVVHSSQWHSVDILLTHFITIITWVNPFSWLYQSCVKQNLEFLADQAATKESESFTNYQYTLLKISGNQYCTPLVNTFYNSLIKKRIVMLNKSRSNKTNLLKVLLILPALAIFLVSFNTKEVQIFVPTESSSISMVLPDSETIEIIIDKNTSKKELEQIKKELLQKGIDFSYSVKHNTKNEISAISIRVTADKNGKSKIKSSSSIDNGKEPIDPIHILIDDAMNSISIGNAKNAKMDLHEENDNTVWLHTDSDGDHKTIEIIEENGKETIKVNGKKISRPEYEAMQKKDGVHEKHIKIKKSKNGDSNVFIWNEDDEHDSDEDIIAVEEGNGFFFIDTDGGKPLYIIDGKESNKDDVEYLNPSDIRSIDVSKGEKAREKYGKKGKNGVVEITTKKKE